LLTTLLSRAEVVVEVAMLELVVLADYVLQ
jgi:hypothetical protein